MIPVIVVTCYQSSDGDIFHSRSAAEFRNEELELIAVANQLLKRGANMWAVLSARHPFPLNESERPILEQITKETKLVISHWQCRDVPGYQPNNIDLKGIYVSGDAGSWSGPYGGHMNKEDLIRYAKNTLGRGYSL